MLDFDSSGPHRHKIRNYEIIDVEDVHSIKWNGVGFEATQIVQSYDTHRHGRTGLIMTYTTHKELYRMGRARGVSSKGWNSGTLYFKVYTKKRGLWEVTLEDCSLKQLEPDALWFRHEGRSSLQILKQPK